MDITPDGPGWTSSVNNRGAQLQQQHSGDRFAGAFGASSSNGGGSGSGKRSPTPGSRGASSTPPGASGSASNPTSPPQGGAGLNPRSCVTCRRRKVKCDKRHPCSNCVRQHIECIFPRPGRAPRKAKKPPDAELMARLRRLEGVVQKLGGSEEGAADLLAAAAASGVSPGTVAADGQQYQQRKDSVSTDVPDQLPELSNPKDNPRLKSGGDRGGMLKIEKEMGNLVVGEGRSRYVSNTFWTTLTDEVSEMRDLINESSDSEEDESVMNALSPESQDTASSAGRYTHQEFVFGYSSSQLSMRILHPPHKQVMTYWDIFVENVDPVVRILHKPTARHLFATAARDQGELSKSTEALVFAVYFAAVTSLSPEECQRKLSLDRETGLKRYRFAVEQALARANFMTCQELIVVQAFTLFLACVRRFDDNKSVWTMVGLLNRMCISIGLHRDGTNFGLSPFQTEIRRRAWWQACTVDVRSSEDQGTEPMVAQTIFDTQMPLNVNDVDIWPDMKEPPIEHEGCTEMTFDLVRYEIGGTIRHLSAAETNKMTDTDALTTLEAKDAMLEKLRIRLEDKYLRHCDMSKPLEWVAANVARLVMAKIWLVIHHPFRNATHGAKISQETKDRTFLTSIDVVRYSRMLWTQHKTSKWGWLFRTYFQWHAVAYLLSDLCERTTGPAVDDAWDVLTEAIPDWEREGFIQKKSGMFKAIQKLLAKARRVRMQELARRRLFPSDGTLGVSQSAWTTSNTATTLTDQLPPQQQPTLYQQHSSPSNASSGASGANGSRMAPHSAPRGSTPATSIGSDPQAATAASIQMGVEQLGQQLPNPDQMASIDTSTFQNNGLDIGMWMDDPFLMENESWDANATPWDNVGLDPNAPFDDGSGMMVDMNMGLWGENGIGGTGF